MVSLRLSPLDVKKQEFNKSMRGYDVVEVDTFLETVSEALETLIREKKDLSDEVMKLRIQLKDYQSVENTLKETLYTAQESVNESRENSRREADMIVREAELKADKILEDSKLKLASMKNELILIKSQKDSFARRLKHLLRAQFDLIGVLELDDLGFESLGDTRVSRNRNNATKSPVKSQELEELPEASSDHSDDSAPADSDEPIQLGWHGRKASAADEPDDDRNSRLSDRVIL